MKRFIDLGDQTGKLKEMRDNIDNIFETILSPYK